MGKAVSVAGRLDILEGPMPLLTALIIRKLQRWSIWLVSLLPFCNAYSFYITIKKKKKVWFLDLILFGRCIHVVVFGPNGACRFGSGYGEFLDNLTLGNEFGNGFVFHAVLWLNWLWDAFIILLQDIVSCCYVLLQVYFVILLLFSVPDCELRWTLVSIGYSELYLFTAGFCMIKFGSNAH